MEGKEEKTFEVFEHMADVGIRAWGETMEEMLENAATGMFSLMAELDLLEEKAERIIYVSAKEADDLLVSWLEELLYAGETEGLILKRAKVERLEMGWRIEGRAYGDLIEDSREALLGEIKGVTLHQLEVSRKADGFWACQVIFDV